MHDTSLFSSDPAGWLSLGLQVISLIGGLAGAIGGIAIFAVRSSLVTKESLDRRLEGHAEVHQLLDKRLEDGEVAFAGIRKDIEFMPGYQEVDGIKRRLGDIEGAVRQQTSEIASVRETLARIERPLNIMIDEKLKGHR